jgi:hypothetical protein
MGHTTGNAFNTCNLSFVILFNDASWVRWIMKRDSEL